MEGRSPNVPRRGWSLPRWRLPRSGDMCTSPVTGNWPEGIRGVLAQMTLERESVSHPGNEEELTGRVGTTGPPGHASFFSSLRPWGEDILADLPCFHLQSGVQVLPILLAGEWALSLLSISFSGLAPRNLWLAFHLVFWRLISLLTSPGMSYLSSFWVWFPLALLFPFPSPPPPSFVPSGFPRGLFAQCAFSESSHPIVCSSVSLHSPPVSSSFDRLPGPKWGPISHGRGC